MLEKDHLSDGSSANFSDSKSEEISAQAEKKPETGEDVRSKNGEKGGFSRYSGRSGHRRAAGFVAGETDHLTEEGKGIGQALKEARERLNLSLEEVAAELKIRSGYLNAIEKEDFKNLPGNAYVFGFIRAYSARLGLDGDDILQRFRQQIDASLPQGKGNFPPQGPDKGPGQKILFGGAVIVLCLALGGWYWHQTGGHAALSGLNMPVPTTSGPVKQKDILHLSASGAQALSAEIKADKITAATDQKNHSPLLPVKSSLSSYTEETKPKKLSAGPHILGQTAELAPKANSAGALTKAEVKAASPVIKTAHIAGAVVPVSDMKSVKVQPVMPAYSLKITVTEPAWISVMNAARTEIPESQVLYPGQSFTVPAGQIYYLTTGNAGGTRLVLNGEVSEPLGGQNKIVRNVPLTKAGFAAYAPAEKTATALQKAPVPKKTPAS